MKLNIFNTANLFEAAANLFQQLGIKLNSNTAEPLPVKDLLKQHYKDNDTFKTIGKTYFIGIIDNTVFQATGMFDVNYSYKEALQQGDKNYDGLMLFALELSKQPTRTEISDLTRTFNRISQKMPVALVLKYKTGNEACFSIAISERFKYKQNWRQGEKAGKVIILRDIHTETTHAGHERILLDLVKPVGVTNYDQLHQHWLQVLDVNILNKKFFQDLANWYFWAMENVTFPDDLEKKKDVRNATNLIRLITRVVFIWFIKEKSLVPNALFNKAHLDKILKDFNKNKKSQNYYHAILQNLFFGTLNQKMDERKFAKDGGNIKTNGEEYGVKNLFRYADLFNISEKDAMQLFKDVPFLNGGLFDCLDKPNEEGKIVYVDGFSRNPKKQASVPDYIFFGEEKEVDLNEIYGTRNKTYKSRGLINLLESYKFTVAENTPIEEEIALDPELLGKVFENLLASYNPETQTTARKQTGSFYTPREIVNYMVDESLLEYIKQNVKNESEDFETRLRDLISYAETPNPFDEQETKDLIEGINNCKILDPACGSGAYPMGILHKMVHLLQKLDADNKHWKALQRQKAMEETETAFKIGDKEERGKRLNEINDVFENNASDYGRKLYLIENCIYGIDIQPIAVQISKLRFFISLIIDQNKQEKKENFGIRSLPNLETKFVAANTLISLDKPAQTLLRNPQIEEKETELKELRHKYFTANTRKEKLQYQKQDKKLRQEIAKMLESDGWQTSVAKQIVAFDPYDQNTFARWFDPEWMFGLTSGFDIVIGNPPYITYKGKEVVDISDAEVKQLISLYPNSAEYKVNSYALFTENGVKLLKKGGTLSFIIPSTILQNEYLKKIRKYLVTKYHISQIVSFANKVFEAVTDSIILNVINQHSKKLDTIAVRKSDLDFSNLDDLKTYNQQNWDDEPNDYVINLKTTEDEDIIISKIELNSEFVDDYLEVYVGIVANGIKKFLSSSKVNSNYKKYLQGKHIDNFAIYPDKLFINFIKEELHSNTDETVYLQKEKILVRKTGNRLIAVIDDEKYFTDQSIYNLYPKRGKTVNLKIITALLNSPMLEYYFNKKMITNPDVFPYIKGIHLKKLPIKLPKDKTLENKIESLVIKIIEGKRNETDVTKLKQQLNHLVYKIYELTEDEINTIEGNE
ncbi:MAG: N-6 DNA methylase [Saprospiraceae bacterium]|nr:N-6 DNA methylase [Saprospiraceae bacterium]